MPLPEKSRMLGVAGISRDAGDIVRAVVAAGSIVRIVVWDADQAAAARWASDLRGSLSSFPISADVSDRLPALFDAPQMVLVDPQALAALARSEEADRSATPKLLLTSPGDAGALPPSAERWLLPGAVALSAEFRRRIAARLRLDPREIHAHIVGGTGELAVPLWSSATAAGIPLHQWAVMGHGRMTVRDRTEIFVGLKESFVDPDFARAAHIAACAEIVQAILTDANRVLTVGTFVANYHGITNAWLAVPCIVNATGAEPPLEVPMNDAELAGLRRVIEPPPPL